MIIMEDESRVVSFISLLFIKNIYFSLTFMAQFFFLLYIFVTTLISPATREIKVLALYIQVQDSRHNDTQIKK